MKRRLFLIVAMVLILAGLLAPGIGVAANQSASDNSVTEAEAEIAALDQVDRCSQTMSEWNGATVSKPVIYYAPDNTKSMYEFTVLNDGKEVGFIAVSARKDWMPILEFSSDKAPSNCLTEVIQQVVDKGYVSEGDVIQPKYFYWGALSYSVQLSDKMKQEDTIIHLPTCRIMPMLEMPSLQMDEKRPKQPGISLTKI